MTTPILDSVEKAVLHFRPRNQREFVALQVAGRLQDIDRLAEYLRAVRSIPKKVLFGAVRLAPKRAKETGQSVAAALFELLKELGGKEDVG